MIKIEKLKKRVSLQLDEIAAKLMSEPGSALSEILKIEQGLPDGFDASLMREIKFRKAQLENILGDFSVAEKNLAELARDLENVIDEPALIKVTNEQGNNYLALNRLEEAADAYLKCLKILEKNQDFAKMCVPMNNIGQIYWYNQDSVKAKEYYLRSLKLAEQYTPESAGDILINLGILAAEQAEFDAAESYYLKALKVLEKFGDNARIPLLYLNFALLYEDCEKFELAGEFHRKTINGFRESHNQFGEMHASMNYSGFLIKQNKLEEVKKLLDHSFALADEVNAESQKIQLYLHYRDYYEKTRKYKTALMYQEKYHDAEVARLESQQKEKTADILAKYESEQKEKEAAVLREKNREIEKQRHELDIANAKLLNVNKELENRVEDIMAKWQSQVMLNQSQESLNGLVSIVSGIAHQWKQPLNNISLIAQNLVDSYEFDEFSLETLNKFSDQLSSQIHYMADIIDDFAYNFKGMQDNREFHLSHTLKVIRKLLDKTLELENIKTEYIIEHDPLIFGRESEIIQVFMVILSNAIELFQQHKTPDPKIKVMINKMESEVNIVVFDNGPQVAEKDIEHLFEAYFSTKSKSTNTGLGLALARKIISERFDGSIICRNVKTGVEFLIKIPIKEK